ncbi:hypothetical protein KP509_10G084600 [Ceratopteris richardii]|uniref:DUF7866 domain-containing protein n=1 Tax=Ceratopteris richardii TaxID=49495 RepID=A0A8T2U439_CERRI|nr:hypothetical protein KP509_10G084600 [Ceratopteris richardii]
MARCFLSFLLLVFTCHSALEVTRVICTEETPMQEEDTVASSSGLTHLLSNETKWEIIPHPDLQKYYFNSSRRSLGSFQICALCTCCGGGHRFCIPTACCYTITCGSPNRPFGLCSFSPMSCNCLSCQL